MIFVICHNTSALSSSWGPSLYLTSPGKTKLHQPPWGASMFWSVDPARPPVGVVSLARFFCNDLAASVWHAFVAWFGGSVPSASLLRVSHGEEALWLFPASFNKSGPRFCAVCQAKAYQAELQGNTLISFAPTIDHNCISVLLAAVLSFLCMYAPSPVVGIIVVRGVSSTQASLALSCCVTMGPPR